MYLLFFRWWWGQDPIVKGPSGLELLFQVFFFVFFFFHQSGFENSCGYGLLVFPSQDLGFSRVCVCVCVLLGNSSHIPGVIFPFLESENFHWASGWCVGEFQDRERTECISPVKNVIELLAELLAVLLSEKLRQGAFLTSECVSAREWDQTL